MPDSEIVRAYERYTSRGSLVSRVLMRMAPPSYIDFKAGYLAAKGDSGGSGAPEDGNG